MSLHKKAHKTLYVTLNLGCSGNCDLCPTKGLESCSRVTVTDLINWERFRDIVSSSRAEDVILIGGESPMYHSDGQRYLFYKIQDAVAPKRKLHMLTTVKGLNENRNTLILDRFDKLFVYIPEVEEKSTSFLWLRGHVDVECVIKPGAPITTELLNKLRVGMYPRPTVIVGNDEKRDILEFMAKNGDFRFISEDCLFNWQSPIYNLMTGEYRPHMQSTKSEKRNRPWKELLKMRGVI